MKIGLFRLRFTTKCSPLQLTRILESFEFRAKGTFQLQPRNGTKSQVVENTEEPVVWGRSAISDSFKEEEKFDDKKGFLCNYKFQICAGRGLANRRKRGIVNPSVQFSWRAKTFRTSMAQRTGRPK
eukprot:Selendium_serpulae@DN7384_c0_g1_i1.p2